MGEGGVTYLSPDTPISARSISWTGFGSKFDMFYLNQSLIGFATSPRASPRTL